MATIEPTAGQTAAVPDIDSLVRPSRMRRAAWLAALGVAVAGAGAFGYVRWLKPEPVVPPTIQEVTVSRGPLATTLTTSGSAAAGQSAALSFPAAGRVASVSVRVGDQVKAGQELARIDDRDAKRKVDTAEVNLAGARTRLAQLIDPATEAELRAASQSISGAESQLANARVSLEKLTRPPTESDYATADAAVAQAQANLGAAELNVHTTRGLLLAAQQVLCANHHIMGVGCDSADLPLSPEASELLGRYTGVTGALVSPNVPQRARDLVNANNTYSNALVSFENSTLALANAQRARAKLDEPVDPLDILQAQASVTSAQKSLNTAVARERELIDGATSFEVQLAQQAVRTAEIALQQARDALDDTVLRAPFDASVSAVGVTLGAQSVNPAVTINNPGAIRVDLTVSESDLPSLKVGQYGLALFDALAGRPVVIRIRGISTLPTVSQGVVSYPVQAEIVSGEALQQARDQLASLLQANPAALRAIAGGAGAPGGAGAFPGGGAPPAGFGGGAGGGQRPQGAGAGTRQTPAGDTSNLPAPGMNASITVLLSVQENVLLLPSNAIKREGRNTFVTIKNASGAQEQVPVTLGDTNGTSTIVASGVDEGATVLIITPAPGTAASATATAKAATGGNTGPGPGGFGGGQVR